MTTLANINPTHVWNDARDNVQSNFVAVRAQIYACAFHVTGFNATGNITLGALPACNVTNIVLTSDTATSGSGAGTKFDFQVTNVTRAVTMLTTVVTTNGNEIAVSTAYPLAPNKNLNVAANDVLRLDVTKTGTPTSLASAKITATVYYTAA